MVVKFDLNFGVVIKNDEIFMVIFWGDMYGFGNFVYEVEKFLKIL